MYVCIWPEYQKPCKRPQGAESRSQSSDLMRDSVSLTAVMTSPSSSSSLSSACRNGWICGWGGEVGIIRWGLGMGAIMDDQGYVMVSTTIWVTAF